MEQHDGHAVAGRHERPRKGSADVVLLLDATSGMGPFLRAFEEQVDRIIAPLAALRDCRMRVIGFRDVLCDAEWYEHNPFVRGAGAIRRQLAALRAFGGGDRQESLLDALWKVVSWGETGRGEAVDASRWRYRSEAMRFVVAFTDSPWRPTLSLPEAAGATSHDLATLIEEKRIRLILLAPTCEHRDALSEISGAEIVSVTDDPLDSGLLGLVRQLESSASILLRIPAAIDHHADDELDWKDTDRLSEPPEA